MDKAQPRSTVLTGSETCCWGMSFCVTIPISLTFRPPFLNTSSWTHHLITPWVFRIHPYRHLDNIFALAGAALNAALHEFYEGVYKPREVNEGNWREYYLESKQLLVGMWQQEGLHQWLQALQTDLMHQVQVSNAATD